MNKKFEPGHKFYVYDDINLVYQGDNRFIVCMYKVLQRLDDSRYYVRVSTDEEIRRSE